MAAEGVFKYLESTNRPYSANDIVQNMHKEFGKTAVQKALDDLVSQGRVMEKAYGKQKIYCVKQPEAEETGQTDLQQMEAEIEKTTQSLKNVDRDVKETETLLKEITAAPTNEEAKELITNLEEKIEALQKKLTSLSQNSVIVSSEERTKISKEHERLVKEYRKRKKMCMEVINAIMEGYPKSKKILMEEVGIETDEDVKMTPLQT